MLDGKTRTSTEKLVAALTEAGASAAMIERAKANYYHDFKSQLATPCMQLVADLFAEGLVALRYRALDGEFDATRAEAEKWAASEDGRATMMKLLGSQEWPKS